MTETSLFNNYNPNPGPSEWLLRRRVGKMFISCNATLSGTILRAMYVNGQPFFKVQRDKQVPIWVHAIRDRAV